MAMDLVIRNARLPNDGIATDIGIEIGRIAAIAPRIVCDAPEFDAGGRMVLLDRGYRERKFFLKASCSAG